MLSSLVRRAERERARFEAEGGRYAVEEKGGGGGGADKTRTSLSLICSKSLESDTPIHGEREAAVVVVDIVVGDEERSASLSSSPSREMRGIQESRAALSFSPVRGSRTLTV
jgi:hypothetical protein